MFRFGLFLGVCLLLAVPAGAQGQPARSAAGAGATLVAQRGPLIAQTGFSPSSGPPGTKVTITGKGFTSQTQILIGGRPVKPSRVRATEIVFEVPDNAGDGAIVLRHPGVARDVPVGRFNLVETARISDFSPVAGPPGTRVEVRGTGFRTGDKVLLQGKAAAVLQSAPKRLVITIPDGASTDYLTLITQDGNEVRSAIRFQVQQPAPAITAITPESGSPGATVRITGQNFPAAVTVQYGTINVPVQRSGSDFIEITIPRTARTDDVLTVIGPSGQARSATPFKLIPAAQVSRFQPAFGAVGQQIAIFGKNFRAGDEVRIGDTALEIVELRPQQISAKIPPGAQTGAVVVERNGVRSLTSKRFEVLYAPVIERFEPAAGNAGTTVTLIGQNFDAKAKVYYGTKLLKPIARKDTTGLVVKIPPKAKSELFTVRTRGGQAVAASQFQVHVYPVLMQLVPKQGPAGTQIRLGGRNLDQVQSLLLEGVELGIVSRDAASITATIPPQARSGKLVVSSHGKQVVTSLGFTVQGAAELTGLSPASGPPGTKVTVTGRGFTDTTEILSGTTVLPVVSRGKAQIVVTIPPGTRAGALMLRARNGLSESVPTGPFQVLAAPSITRFEPESVEAGAQVFVVGENFTASTKVLWGDLELPVKKRDANGRGLMVTIPERAVGVRYLFVDDGAARYQSRAQLEVRTPRPKKLEDRRK